MLKQVLKQYFRGVNKWGFLVIILGTLTWSLTMVKSGLLYPFGMGFWGPNGHDGVWHIALSESLSRGSWNIPVFAGETIKNYHIGFDLILVFLHKVTLIPIHNLYFQILPPILALLIGFFAYKFTLSWTKSVRCAFLATFFVYFGGGWGFLVSIFRNGELGGESVFWSQQAISTLINPPFALSILIMFAALLTLNKGLKTKDKRLLTIATFLFGILVQIKVYAGVLALIGLFFAGLTRILKRKGISVFKVFTGSLLISILLFPSVTQGVGNTLIFKPFWFLETMMQFPDRLGWTKFGEAMVNYKLAGNFIKGIPAYLFAFLIFWLGSLGTRVVKEFLVIKWLKDLRKVTYVEVFMASVIVFGLLIPLLFVQSGNPWNTIQFMYYSLVFSGILAGVWLGEFLEKYSVRTEIHPKDGLDSHPRVLRYFLVFVTVLMTVPTTIGTLWFNYLPGRPPAKISNEELEALEFLSEQSYGIVLTFPFNKEEAQAAVNNPPRPLYLYESTAYVSAFSGQPTFLEDEVNLEITGYDWRKRRLDSENYLFSSNADFLKAQSISYLYFIKPLDKHFVYSDTLTRIFTNKEVDIFKVN